MGKVTIDSQIQAMLEADDSSALELIWDRYADALFGYLVSLLRSRHDAEDVQQTVFVQIARSHQLVAKAGCLKSYLFSMARNAATNFTRQRKRNERLRAECDVWLLPAKDTDSPMLDRDEMAAALEALPEAQRTVVILKVYQDMTFCEIAEALGISENTAASRYRYGKEKLRKLMGSRIT